MLYSSTKRFYNAYLISNLSKINGINIAGNIHIIIAGSYSSNSSLDRFVDIGGLYSIGKFYSIGVFNYNSSRGG